MVLAILCSIHLPSAQAVLLAQTATPEPEEYRIDQPAPNSVVRGMVQVIGSASIPGFDRYEIHLLGPGFAQPAVLFGNKTRVINGPLYQWNTLQFQDGTYVLILRVIDFRGQFKETRITVQVENASTPTPTASPTPTETPLPATTPQSPGTPVVLVTPIAAATPGITPRPVSSLLPRLEIDLQQLCLRPFLLGLVMAGGLALLLGLIALARALLSGGSE